MSEGISSSLRLSFISGFSFITPVPEQGASTRTASNAPSYRPLKIVPSAQTAVTLAAPMRAQYAFISSALCG